MRKLLFVLLFVLFTLVAQIGCRQEAAVDVTFPNGRVVKCEIADTAKKIRAGLQFHDGLPADRGMLFIYPAENTNVGFYMPKRMKFNLDMIFLDKDKKILLIEKDLPPCETEVSEDCPTYGPRGKPCKYVVEVIGGFCSEIGLEEGETLKFDLP